MMSVVIINKHKTAYDGENLWILSVSCEWEADDDEKWYWKENVIKKNHQEFH